MFIYKQTEPKLWTVGHYDPRGIFIPESDHATSDDAAARTSRLNGGHSPLVDAAPEMLKVLKRLVVDLPIRGNSIAVEHDLSDACRIIRQVEKAHKVLTRAEVNTCEERKEGE